MLQRLALMTVALAILAGTASAEKLGFKIDDGHSQAVVKVVHFGVSGLRGIFTGADGFVEYDAENPTNSSVTVSFDVTTFQAGSEKREAAILGPFFLDAENHPKISFTSKGVMKVGDGYQAVGDLTIRGVTREVTFPFEITGPRDDPFGSWRLGVEGRLSIDRTDYEVPFDRKFEDGTPWVGTQVEIEVVMEAVLPKQG